MATWGTMNWVRSSPAMLAGRSTASCVSSRLRAQRCSLSAISMFSLPLRIMSMIRCSSSLIFSRSISAWRSCRLTARLPCGLVICTAASTSAWRAKNSGVFTRKLAISSSVMGWLMWSMVPWA
jgi:hypothetical protein